MNSFRNYREVLREVNPNSFHKVFRNVTSSCCKVSVCRNYAVSRDHLRDHYCTRCGEKQ